MRFINRFIFVATLALASSYAEQAAIDWNDVTSISAALQEVLIPYRDQIKAEGAALKLRVDAGEHVENLYIEKANKLREVRTVIEMYRSRIKAMGYEIVEH